MLGREPAQLQEPLEEAPLPVPRWVLARSGKVSREAQEFLALTTVGGQAAAVVVRVRWARMPFIAAAGPTEAMGERGLQVASQVARFIMAVAVAVQPA